MDIDKDWSSNQELKDYYVEPDFLLSVRAIRANREMALLTCQIFDEIHRKRALLIPRRIVRSDDL